VPWLGKRESYTCAVDYNESTESTESAEIMWEDKLGKQVNGIIKVSCCHAEAHHMLHFEMAKDSPKLIPWLCMHGNCDKCGITNFSK
jgi:hypothetical protein